MELSFMNALANYLFFAQKKKKKHLITQNWYALKNMHSCFFFFGVFYEGGGYFSDYQLALKRFYIIWFGYQITLCLILIWKIQASIHIHLVYLEKYTDSCYTDQQVAVVGKHYFTASMLKGKCPDSCDHVAKI